MTPHLLSEISAIASFVTAIGVFFAVLQLRLTKQQAVTTFEDTIAHEYRDLSTRIPKKAFLGEELSDDEYASSIREFFHYIDLSNEEVFLRKIGRVRCKTWTFWRDGIKSNLRRPAFKRAWDDISGKVPNDFKELRDLILSDYKDDPRDWS